MAVLSEISVGEWKEGVGEYRQTAAVHKTQTPPKGEHYT